MGVGNQENDRREAFEGWTGNDPPPRFKNAYVYKYPHPSTHFLFSDSSLADYHISPT